MFVNPIFLDIDINQGLDDEVEHSHEHKDQDEVLDEIAGFLITVQPWRTFLINKLPRDVTGLDIHIQSNCGDRFAYRLNGREAEFCKSRERATQKYEPAILTPTFSFIYL